MSRLNNPAYVFNFLKNQKFWQIDKNTKINLFKKQQKQHMKQ